MWLYADVRPKEVLNILLRLAGAICRARIDEPMGELDPEDILFGHIRGIVRTGGLREFTSVFWGWILGSEERPSKFRRRSERLMTELLSSCLHFSGKERVVALLPILEEVTAFWAAEFLIAAEVMRAIEDKKPAEPSPAQEERYHAEMVIARRRVDVANEQRSIAGEVLEECRTWLIELGRE